MPRNANRVSIRSSFIPRIKNVTFFRMHSIFTSIILMC